MPERQLCVKPKHRCLLAAGALVCLVPTLMRGQTNDTFTNGAGTGLWNNAGNWSAGLPGSGSNVLITGAGSAASVSQDVTATINNMTLHSGNAWTLTNGR